MKNIMNYLLTAFFPVYNVDMEKILTPKPDGHIRYYKCRSTLCGEDREVEHTGLYGSQCGECYELARYLLRGGSPK